MVFSKYLDVNVSDSRESFRLTVWPDGVAVYEGRKGQMKGPWTGLVPVNRLRVVEALLSRTEPSTDAASVGAYVVSIVSDDDRRTLFFDKKSAGPNTWIAIQAIAGLIIDTPWFPDKVQWLSDANAYRNAPRIRLSHKGTLTEGLYADGTVIVLAGSLASAESLPSLSASHSRFREKLIETGAWLSESSMHFRVARHIYFRSLAAAASTLSGSPTSSTLCWTDTDGAPWRN